MEKKKKIILLLIIISIIAFIAVGIILSKESEREKEQTAADMNEDISNVKMIEKEIYFQDYKIIKNCLQTYINTINVNDSGYYGRGDNGEYIKVVDETDIKSNIYNLISKNYIEKNNITIENVYNYIDTTTENKIIIPVNVIDETQNGENINVKKYKVSALAISTINKESFSYLYLIINVDNKNNTFSIEPVKDEETLENTKINYEMKSIEKTYNNTFFDVKSTEEEIALDYFSNYKNILLSDMNLAYSYLDNEYRNKKFKDTEKFEEYINNNKKIFEQIRLEQYVVEYYDDYFQYVCVDQFGNIYVFNEKETMDYNVILDLYTIDLPQFIEKYDSSNTQEKVLLNIEKVKQALNSGDYTYVYSKLAQNFKDNKYKTEQEFENYIKDTLYNYVDIEYNNFENEGETYIYNVTIKNLMNESDKEINMQIIMQLKDERDFIMSFNITE